ncbi:MAG: hypothetical protein JXQ27_00365 [Acidobacteria bacterium]|nr:hypothetical protein [Acidobacteriota bacterium]
MKEIILVGLITGGLMGMLLCSAFRFTMNRTAEGPSPLGRFLALGALFLVSALMVGPALSVIYRVLMIRFFGAYAWWIFGLMHTVILAIGINYVAWRRRLPDLPLIVMINLGATLVLGWGIPFLYFLLD